MQAEQAHVHGAAGWSLCPDAKWRLDVGVATLERCLSLGMLPSIQPAHGKHPPCQQQPSVSLRPTAETVRIVNVHSQVMATDPPSVQFS